MYGVEIMTKDGQIKKFYGDQVNRALKDGWKIFSKKVETSVETPVEKPVEKATDDYENLPYAKLKDLAKEKGLENTQIKKEELIAFLRGE